MKSRFKKQPLLFAGFCLITVGSVIYLMKDSGRIKPPVQSFNVDESVVSGKQVNIKTDNAEKQSLQDDTSGLLVAGKQHVGEEVENENTLTLGELQNREIDFQNMAEINDFLKSSVSLPYAALAPLINKLKKDAALKQEWLTYLINADPDNVFPGTEVVLAALPAQDLANFASDSLAFADKNVVAVTMAAMAQQSDLNPAGNDLTSLVVHNLKNGELSNNVKANALNVLAKGADLYSEAERNAVLNAVSEQLLEPNHRLQSEAVNALLKIDPSSQVIEDFVITGIQNENIETRKHALQRLDYRLELGLELTSQAVSTIHSQILNDLNGGIEFAEGEREDYAHTAAYILGSLALSQSQVYEMEASGLPYEDHRQENLEPEPVS